MWLPMVEGYLSTTTTRNVRGGAVMEDPSEMDDLVVDMGDAAELTLGGRKSANENKREVYN